MNTTQAEFIATGGTPSQTDKFITCLMEAQGAWVPLPTLVDYCGGFAIHSRCSDARRMGYNIENQVRYDRESGKRFSYYRVIP